MIKSYEFIEQHQIPTVCPECGVLATAIQAEIAIKGEGIKFLSELSMCPNGHTISKDDPRWDDLEN